MSRYTINIESGKKMSKGTINIENKENKENVKDARNVESKQKKIPSRQ